MVGCDALLPRFPVPRRADAKHGNCEQHHQSLYLAPAQYVCMPVCIYALLCVSVNSTLDKSVSLSLQIYPAVPLSLYLS